VNTRALKELRVGGTLAMTSARRSCNEQVNTSRCLRCVATCDIRPRVTYVSVRACSVQRNTSKATRTRTRKSEQALCLASVTATTMSVMLISRTNTTRTHWYALPVARPHISDRLRRVSSAGLLSADEQAGREEDCAGAGGEPAEDTVQAQSCHQACARGAKAGKGQHEAHAP
jgi:hypothetical protein